MKEFALGASAQLRLLKSASGFKRLCQLSNELSKHKDFNLFRLADKTISENAWSRIFAWLLNSTEDHQLGLRPFVTWLRLGVNQRFPFGKFTKNAEAVLTTNESPTTEGRRLDIVVTVIDKQSRVLAVLGVENKVWSDEQANQVRDYQGDLDARYPSSQYPGVGKLLIFLTPDGRESTTADVASKTCPYLPQSYNTIIDLCDSLGRISDINRSLGNLLEQMKNYLRTEIATTRDEMQAKKLVHGLYADDQYRGALQLISRHKPSTSDLLQRLKVHVEKALQERRPYVEHYWITQPPRDNHPHAFFPFS